MYMYEFFPPGVLIHRPHIPQLVLCAVQVAVGVVHIAYTAAVISIVRFFNYSVKAVILKIYVVCISRAVALPCHEPPVIGIARKSAASARATTQTKTGSKDITATDSNGNVEWKYTLSATFSYVYGSSVSCTSSTYKNNIYDSSWTFSNGSATRSGNTAYGKGHYTKKVLFVTTKNYDVDISVSCDKYGNIS